MQITPEQKEYLLSLIEERYPAWQGIADPRFVKDELSYKRKSVTLHLDEQRKETANPDILVMQRNQARAVIDTKHKVLKGRPKEEDRRQLLEYANNLRLNNGYLVYSGGSAEQVSREYRGGWSFALHAIVWNLDGTLDEFRQRCQGKARDLLAEIRRLESGVAGGAPQQV